MAENCKQHRIKRILSHKNLLSECSSFARTLLTSTIIKGSLCTNVPKLLGRMSKQIQVFFPSFSTPDINQKILHNQNMTYVSLKGETQKEFFFLHKLIFVRFGFKLVYTICYEKGIIKTLKVGKTKNKQYIINHELSFRNK